MKRDAWAGVMGALALLGVFLLLFLLFDKEPRAVPSGAADTPDAAAEGVDLPEPLERRGREDDPPPLQLPPAPEPPEASTRAEVVRRKVADAIEEDWWREYPDGATGPVVVGALLEFGESDPDAWVALEDVSDPQRPDPSKVESLNWGRFRMTGFAPGRYRVRAKKDDGIAVYSDPFTVRDGEIVDAGLIRLRKGGRISGVVHAPDGSLVSATVNLFGRDAASLQWKALETATSDGRAGFVLKAHEAGELVIGAHADEGYAVHRSGTDSTGSSWEAVYLKPWARLEVRFEEGLEKEERVIAVEVEPLQVELYGQDLRRRGAFPGGEASRFSSGRYRVTAVLRSLRAAGVKRKFQQEVYLVSGQTTKLLVTR
ncbi:MAG: hypothetical protein ACYTDX_01445 [Planctomycetota bacterium]|jgi:hypothetical protein